MAAGHAAITLPSTKGVSTFMRTSLEPEPDLRLVNEPPRLWRGTTADLREVWRHRELLKALAGRELRARYKGAALGWAWALVRPLVMLLVYGLAVGVFLGAGRAIPQFMVFIYTGLLAWTFFSTVVMGCINALIGSGGLLSKANFPRLLLPLSVLLSTLVDFMLQAIVLLVGYAIFSDFPELAALAWLPPAMFVLLMVSLGVGLFFAAINVYIRDISFLVDVGLQVGFWLSPIIYSYGQVARGAEAFGWAGDVATRIYMLNPMANVIIGFQRALWPAASYPEAAEFAFPGRLDLRMLIFSLVAVFVAWVGMRVYVRLSRNFGQEL